MKVVALGGSGAMGVFAVQTALKFDFVEELVIADLDRDAAEALANRSGPRARAVGIDVRDEAALMALLEPADVVMTTVGPYFRFGVPILEAAIAARCHYVDVCDDWEPTLEMLALDDAAREAGVSAVIGLGASPGVTNLLAVEAARALDEVDTLHTGWKLEGDESDLEDLEHTRESAALEHWMHQLSGTIRLLDGGGLVDAKPLSKRLLRVPGVGRVTSWTIGHPEPVTMPRTFGDLRASANVMVGSRVLIEAVRHVAGKVDRGRTDARGAARELIRPPRFWWDKKLVEWLVMRRRHPALSLVFAYAEGRKDGRRQRAIATVSALPAGGMGGATGVPLGVGLALFENGAIERRGVFAPEAGVPPAAFFEALAPHCDPPRTGGAGLLSVRTG